MLLDGYSASTGQAAVESVFMHGEVSGDDGAGFIIFLFFFGSGVDSKVFDG